MELPLELRYALEERAEGHGIPRLVKEARELSARYREKNANGKRLLTTDSEAAAYAASRMPATFGAAASALFHALAQMDEAPATLLDVGTGTGAAVWAAAALLDLDSVVCLEREGAMRRLGESLMKQGGPALRDARWLTDDFTTGALPEGAELVTASYVLGELPDSAVLPAAEKLWRAAGKLLLLVEPGTPEGFSRLREVRAHLLSKGAHLAAPCPHENACPIATDNWCHFTCRISRSKLQKLLKGGEAPYEDEKFAYLALTRAECVQAEGRILRHPYIEPGKITMELCTASGLSRSIIRKRDGALFKQARKAVCGDAFSPSRREP